MAPNWPPDDRVTNRMDPPSRDTDSASNGGQHGSPSTNLFPISPEADRPGPQLVPVPQTTSAPSPVAIWIDRIGLVIKVVFYIELGMLLAVLPWTRVWTDNNLIIAYPRIRAIIQEGWLRGAVTGIGLVDIWIGIWEAVHYRDRK